MCPIDDETFIDDGEFIDDESGNKFSFDWEYRPKYFESGVFMFDSLGQYERKIIKPSIQLSIQCDSNFTAIAVAWHEDFKKENVRLISLDTDYKYDQLGKIRYTKKFKIYPFTQMNNFKEMINRSLSTGVMNSTIFGEMRFE